MTHKTKNVLALFMILLASVLVLSACEGEHTHQYGDWTVTKAATCTEVGEEARYCSCGDTQTRELPIQEHSYGEWTVTKAATCTETGIQERQCSCGEKQTQSLSSIWHSYGEATTTKEPTCTAPGSSSATCTVCGTTNETSIPALGHNTDSNSTCLTCGRTVLNLTDSEIAKCDEVATMSHSVSEYSDEIYINITLKDENSYAIRVPVYVDVEIVDDNGTTLYSKTLVKKATQDKVTIDYDEITNALTNTGTLYYTVYNDYVSFDTIGKELENIPWTVAIELPSVPKTISDTGYDGSSCRVTGITYRVSGDDVTFYFTGEKTSDDNGSGYSQSCKIGWKLYDEDGYVVDNGTCYTTSIKVGEKFKDAATTAYNVIEKGKTYRLVIMNVS